MISPNKNTIWIGVVGGRKASRRSLDIAYSVGSQIAQSGAILVTGGLGGIMESASKGAFDSGGMVVGIIPQDKRDKANDFVHIVIPTGLDVVRNFLVVRCADAIIAINGEWGTLSEISIAKNIGKPVVALDVKWKLDDIIICDSPKEAVEKALKLAKNEQQGN